MIVRSLSGTGDWTFGKGRNNYRRNNSAITQNIDTRLKMFLGDCYFALNEGLDWFNLLGSKAQLSLELAVRAVILNTDGVTGLVDSSVILTRNSRLITLKYTVNTVYTGVSNLSPITSQSSFLLTQDGDVLTTEDGDPLIAG